MYWTEKILFHNFRFIDNILGGKIRTYFYLYMGACVRTLFILCDLSMTSKHDKPLLGILDQVLELGSAIFNHTKGSNSSLPWNKSFEMLIVKKKSGWSLFIENRLYAYLLISTSLQTKWRKENICVEFLWYPHIKAISK